MTAVAVENLPMVTDYHSAKEFDYGRRRDGEKGSLVTGRYLPFFVSYNHRPFFVSYNHRHGNTVKNTNTIARFGITYYDTEVVSFHPMGQIEINCGEWPSANTARIITCLKVGAQTIGLTMLSVSLMVHGTVIGKRKMSVLRSDTMVSL